MIWLYRILAILVMFILLAFFIFVAGIEAFLFGVIDTLVIVWSLNILANWFLER